MEWMINTQLGRRNLSAGELIFANSMVAEEIAIENKEKQLEGTYKSHEARRNGSVQMDGSNDEKKSHTSPTHTREQVARLSGVGTGTYRMGAKILDSDNEDYFIIKKYFFSELNTYIFEQIRRIQVCVV